MYAFFKAVRKIGRAGILVSALTALGACGNLPSLGGGGGGGPSIDTSKPVPVALLVPKGSSQRGDALLARSLENSARLAMADLSGVKIDLRVYDTGGSAALAASAATQAINDGAKVILGPVFAEAANAAGIAAASRNVNVLSFSNNTAIAGGNVFVLGPTFDNTARRLARYAAANGKRNILVVHGTDVAGSLGRDAIQRALGSTPASMAGSVPYDLSQQAVIAAVPQVVSSVQSSGADAVFLTANSAGALPLFTQLLPERGVTPSVTQFIGLTRWDVPPQTLELPGVQGGWFALPDPGKVAQFRSRYQAAYGSAPHPIGGLAYDGIAAIGALVKAGKSNALTGASLTQGAGFQGVNGIFRLRPDGSNERGLAVATIQNKQVVVIDTAPSSFAGAGF